MPRLLLTEMAATLVEIDLINTSGPYDLSYLSNVIRVAKSTAKSNNVKDMELVILGAIFHDCDAIQHSDLYPDTENISRGLTKENVCGFLKSHRYPAEKIKVIMDIISECSVRNISKVRYHETCIEKGIIHLSVTAIIKAMRK